MFVFYCFALESASCGLKRATVSILNRSQIIREGEVIHMSKVVNNLDVVGQFQSSGLWTHNFPAGKDRQVTLLLTAFVDLPAVLHLFLSRGPTLAWVEELQVSP